MFAANAEFDIGTRFSSQFRSHLHKSADARLIQLCERIAFVNLLFVICRKEFTRVVTAETECHLREIVRAEREEFRFFRDLVGSDRRARDLDHGADFIMNVHAGFFNTFVRRFYDDTFYVCEFLDLSDERNHDFGNDIPFGMSFGHVDCRADDRARLHCRDFRIRYRQAAAAMSHHRVEFVQRSDDAFERADLHIHFLREGDDVRFRRGQEFMQRRIEETNGYGIAFHRFIERFEIALLHGKQFCKRLFALFHRGRNDHFAHGGDPVGIEEHMLRTAKPDAFRAERARLLRVFRCVGVGAHLQFAVFVRPRHNPAEIAGNGCGYRLDRLAVNVAR